MSARKGTILPRSRCRVHRGHDRRWNGEDAAL